MRDFFLVMCDKFLLDGQMHRTKTTSPQAHKTDLKMMEKFRSVASTSFIIVLFVVLSANNALHVFPRRRAAGKLTRLFSGVKLVSPKKKKLQSFARYLEVECWKQSEMRDLQPVLMSIADACRQISLLVQRAQTDDLYGEASVDGETNVQGEVQQKLDTLCNTIFLRAFCACSNSITAVASEEEDVTRSCADIMGDSSFAAGDYIAVFDPIDGSKNIDASLPVGSIFGIYRDSSLVDDPFLQDGRNALIASGYCLFSATTVLVVTLGSGVDGFTLDPDKGVFLHTHKDIRIPSSGPIYSFNEANYHDFGEPVKRYLTALKEGSSSVGVRSNARYIGALVADVHNVLINGGIYGYPATRRNPNGKLRLLYECCPMAMIMEQAGGAASTGTCRILDVQPKDIHERIPTFIGSIENVYELDQFFEYYGSDEMESPEK